MFRYKLRTLLIVLAIGPMVLAGVIWFGEPLWWYAFVWLGVLPG